MLYNILPNATADSQEKNSCMCGSLSLLNTL